MCSLENLRIIRKKRNKNQLNVAIAVGVSQELISMYENGNTQPSIDILIKLAKYLETSTDYLLGLTNNDTQIKYMDRKLNKKEQELFEKFIYLKNEDQIKLMGYAESLMEKVNN